MKVAKNVQNADGVHAVSSQLTNWPPEEGRYTIGNPKSPIAICTEATVAGLDFDKKKVAIWGKCVTENVGIEKIVKNTISNPNIRFLILCGKKSHGHDVGQTIISLIQKGLNDKSRVIGSTGSIPVIKHLSKDEITSFQKQIIPVDLQGNINLEDISLIVEKCLKKNPGPFKGKKVKIEKLIDDMSKIKCLNAKIDNAKFSQDPLGSFKITIDKDTKVIICRHYDSDFNLDFQIVGPSAHAIRDTIIKNNLIGDYKEKLDHAAYLGQELAKAEICLKNNIDYSQDKDILIKLKAEKDNPIIDNDDFGW